VQFVCTELDLGANFENCTLKEKRKSVLVASASGHAHETYSIEIRTVFLKWSVQCKAPILKKSIQPRVGFGDSLNKIFF
jgi:hypothetical protein